MTDHIAHRFRYAELNIGARLVQPLAHGSPQFGNRLGDGEQADLEGRKDPFQRGHPSAAFRSTSASRRAVVVLQLPRAIRPAAGRYDPAKLGRSARRDGRVMPWAARAVHRLPLAEADVQYRGGLRVTDVPRTLADLLRNGGRDDALVAVESALGHRRVGGVRRPPLIAPAALSVALEAPLLGSNRAREWLRLVDRESGSPAETVARLRMLDAGLRPETQVEVRTPSGRRRYLDFLFRAEGLAVEIEGYAYHGTREAHRRDMARFNEITRCPEVRHVLRFGAAEVFEGGRGHDR
ncbi:hypothetical protein [Streptomyces sp. NPDC057238]|uniref:hypothetical protein n=1 Tax=unclassified Streptomyces TaxID=2593676 RepID=UPI00363B2E4C